MKKKMKMMAKRRVYQMVRNECISHFYTQFLWWTFTQHVYILLHCKNIFFCIVTIIQVMLPKRYLKVHRGASSFFPIGSISTKTMQPRRCGCVGPKKNQTSPEMLMYKPSVSDPNLKKKKREASQIHFC